MRLNMKRIFQNQWSYQLLLSALLAELERKSYKTWYSSQTSHDSGVNLQYNGDNGFRTSLMTSSSEYLPSTNFCRNTYSFIVVRIFFIALTICRFKRMKTDCPANVNIWNTIASIVFEMETMTNNKRRVLTQIQQIFFRPILSNKHKKPKEKDGCLALTIAFNSQ
jgi:hypothetical protein